MGWTSNWRAEISTLGLETSDRKENSPEQQRKGFGRGQGTHQHKYSLWFHFFSGSVLLLTVLVAIINIARILVSSPVRPTEAARICFFFGAKT
jgi:hypothetical protein